LHLESAARTHARLHTELRRLRSWLQLRCTRAGAGVVRSSGQQAFEDDPVEELLE
jgi:hypothetical protein